MFRNRIPYRLFRGGGCTAAHVEMMGRPEIKVEARERRIVRISARARAAI
jgi:hypothetical protein